MPHGGNGGGGRPFKPDVDQAPFLVIWETTQACDLACKHCRAEARPWRDPKELSTYEAKRMLDRIREFGPIIFVFSGGDCFKRPDIVELTKHAHDLGLRVAATPATTSLASRELLTEMRDAGLARVAVSLDGSHPGIHDEFRQVAGSFDNGLRILKTALELGMTTQVNTVVARHNLDDFDALCELMTRTGISFWEVFFLVPIGRAGKKDVASAKEFEAVFGKLYELSRTAPFDIKATAAPHYQRYVLQRRTEEAIAAAAGGEVVGGHAAGPDILGRARGVNDGDGFMFISHTGDIMPSGFLPEPAGNVRRNDLVDVYRTAPLFRALRNRSEIKGKCGVCEYLPLCGGSRARAWAVTGDIHASEPYCSYIPELWGRRRIRELPVAGAAAD